MSAQAFLSALAAAQDPVELENALTSFASSIGIPSQISNEDKESIQKKLNDISQDEKLVNNAKMRRRVKRFVSMLDETEKPEPPAPRTQEKSSRYTMSSILITDAAAIIDGCRTLPELERIMNSIVIPTKEDTDSYSTLQSCKTTLVSSLQKVLANESITNKLLRRRIARMVYAISDSNEQAAITKQKKQSAAKKPPVTTTAKTTIRAVQRKPAATAAAAVSATAAARKGSNEVEEPGGEKRVLIYSAASISQCIEILNVAKLPSDVETAIDALTAADNNGSGHGDTESYQKLHSLLLSIADNTVLVANAKLRRRLKRLLSSLDETITNSAASNSTATTSSNSNSTRPPIDNFRAPLATATSSAVYVSSSLSASLGSFSDCLTLLSAAKTPEDVENALSNISIESPGDSHTKAAVRKLLEQLSTTEEQEQGGKEGEGGGLVNSSKLRRKVKRLCEMLAKEEEKVSAVLLDAVGMPLEDIIARVSALDSADVVNGPLVAILAELKPNAGNCTSRRTLKRAITRAVSNAETASGVAVTSDISDAVARAIEILSPKPGSGELVAKLLEEKKSKQSKSDELAAAAAAAKGGDGSSSKGAGAAADGGEGGEDKPPAGALYVLFAGQLPFNATAEDLEQHLRGHGIEGEVKIRILTETGTQKSRGMAFIQVEGARELRKCMALNHSVLQGRRINIEKSCGGRNKEVRTTRLQQQRSEQHAAKVETLTALLQPYEDKGMLPVDSLDDGLLNRLCSLPPQATAKIAEQFVGSNDPGNRTMSELSRLVSMQEEGRQSSFVGKPPPPIKTNKRGSSTDIEGDDGDSGDDGGRKRHKPRDDDQNHDNDKNDGSSRRGRSSKRQQQAELPVGDNVPWGYSGQPHHSSSSSTLAEIFPSVRGRGGKINIGSRGT